MIRIASWSQYEEYIRKSPDVPDPLKEKAVASYDFLKAEFGEKFLSTVVRGHPLGLKIFNRAPWQLEDLVQFVECLKRLKSYECNYPELIKKLKSRDKCRAEGIPFVEIAQILHPSDFQIEVEPKVDFNKKPDLRIVAPASNEIFFGEVTVLNESDDRKRKSDDHFILFEIVELTAPYVHFGCRQKGFLNRERVDELAAFVNACKQRVIDANSFEIFENEFITIGFASESNVDELNAWLKESDLDFDQVRGLSLDFDETKRIINNKLSEKADQIPEGHNGLVFIKVNPLFFRSPGVINSLSQLPKALNQYPRVIGLVIFSFLGFEKQAAFGPFKNAFISVRPVNQHQSRYCLFVFNEKTQLLINEDTLSRLVNSFQ